MKCYLISYNKVAGSTGHVNEGGHINRVFLQENVWMFCQVKEKWPNVHVQLRIKRIHHDESYKKVITNEMLFHLVQHRIDVIKGEGFLPSQAFEEREESSTKSWRLATKIQTKISKIINGKNR